MNLLHDPFIYLIGNDLLSHKRSTIGATGLNFSVRNGKRWNTRAIATIKSLDQLPGLALRVYSSCVPQPSRFRGSLRQCAVAHCSFGVRFVPPCYSHH